MKIAIVGSGYVGLVTATCLAELGFHTTCVDRDETKIQSLKAGKVPIFEPHLTELVEKNIANSRLKFTNEYDQAISESALIFITVGTPQQAGNNHLDLSDIFQVQDKIAPHLGTYKVIAIKSTVPVGTNKKIFDYTHSLNPQAQFDIVSNPEFLRAGSAVHDFMAPDRIVIGARSSDAMPLMREVYSPFSESGVPILETSPETAELIKQAANTFLATKLAFINQLSDLCEVSGGDIQDLTKGLSYDPRIGGDFLKVGPGFGGSCLMKDAYSLTASGDSLGVDLSIAKSVLKANRDRKKSMAKRILDCCGGSVKGKKIAVLGLTFKRNTDDLRESPSLDIVPALIASGASVSVFDPKGMPTARGLFPNAQFARDEYAAIEGADAAVILSEWDIFAKLNLERVYSMMRGNTFIDLRNLFSVHKMKECRFDYTPLGSPKSYTTLFPNNSIASRKGALGK